MNTNVSKMMAVGAAMLVLLAALPVAQAQSQVQTKPILDLSQAEVSPSNVVADTTVATVSIDWAYDISAAPYGLATELQGTTTMTWDSPTCDKQGVVIAGPLSNIVSVTRDSTGTTASADGTKQFTLQATQEAPGETSISCTFAAQAESLGQQVTASDKKETTGVFIVNFLGLISANLPSTIKQAGPQKEIKYDIELTNLGNSRSTVRFDLITENVGKWDPVTPSEIILDSPNQGGAETTKTVSFQVSTPFKNGWNNDQKTFQVRITPISTKDANIEGTPVTVNVLSRVRGVYVPTLEPVLLAAAVLGTAFVARRLRDE